MWLTLTHLGARGRTCMLILAADTIPDHCYYTQLCQLCVFLSLYLSAPFTIFTPFLWAPPPRRAFNLFPSLSTYKFGILFSAQMWRLLMTDLRRLQPCYLPCRLPALVHSLSLVIYLAVLHSSVQISLSRVGCNIIFCLSPSGYVHYCCYCRSLGLSWQEHMPRGWVLKSSCPTVSPSPPPSCLSVVHLLHFVLPVFIWPLPDPCSF